MTQDPYERCPGDLEIRILADGRIVLIAPDQTMLDIAAALQNSEETQALTSDERPRYDRKTNHSDGRQDPET